MQLVAYSQSEGNHAEDAAEDIIVEDGEGQGEAELPVDTDAHVQGHERALLVWHPDSPVGHQKGAHLVGVRRGLPVPPWLTSCCSRVRMPVDLGMGGLRMLCSRKCPTRRAHREAASGAEPGGEAEEEATVVVRQQADSQTGLRDVLVQQEAGPYPTPASAQQLPQTADWIVRRRTYGRQHRLDFSIPTAESVPQQHRSEPVAGVEARP